MKKLVFVLSILILIAAGGAVRLFDTGNMLHARGGIPSEYALSGEEAEWDHSARLLIQLQKNRYAAAALSRSRTASGGMTSGACRLIAACYTFFGYEPALPYHQIRLLLQVLDIGTGLLLYAAVLLMLGAPALAWMVSALYMAGPLLQSPSAWLPSDGWSTFLQAWVLCCLLLFFGMGRSSKLVGLLCGVTFGFGTLLDPPLFPFLLLFAGAAGLRCFYTRRDVAPFLLALACCLFILAPWWLHSVRTAPAPDRIIARQLSLELPSENGLNRQDRN
ncbi:hypothetical protein [Gorillibacterium sp. sgz5001074]|uniref:hypothetical protein n=1 Tax=Gorillibacterium sp. sgz5001074 TaxID=3446695 RepID=UPI003F674A90